MMSWLCVAVGGALGAVARWMVSKGMSAWCASIFPWGTLLVNALGALVLGFCGGFIVRGLWPEEAKLLVATGFVGAFTTFSAYSFETVLLWKQGELRWAMANILLNNIVSIVCVVVGLKLWALVYSENS